MAYPKPEDLVDNPIYAPGASDVDPEDEEQETEDEDTETGDGPEEAAEPTGETAAVNIEKHFESVATRLVEEAKVHVIQEILQYLAVLQIDYDRWS